MSDSAALEPSDLGCEMERQELADNIQPATNLREARDKVEREMIATVIDQQKGSIVKAAEMLGVSRPTLYDLMKKHNMTPLQVSDK
jgi:two-component system NtrC family response regulator